MKGKSERQEKSSGSKPLAQSPSKGGCVQVRVPARSLILGQMWKKTFSINHSIFKSEGCEPKTTPSACSHQRTEKTKTNREKLPMAGLHFL